MVSRVVSSSRSKSDDVYAEQVASRNIPLADPFAALGLHGLSRLAPVILGALVTGEPLLLIGPHGTAKTLLLTRVAADLGLSCRHYNASLLSFDDLVGFPLPDGEKGLRYVTTPSAIWGAGAVIFDEISRCRPDIQNKLFPIIHERRAQGLEIEGLVYRWAAMNPPSGQDNEDADYRGFRTSADRNSLAYGGRDVAAAIRDARRSPAARSAGRWTSDRGRDVDGDYTMVPGARHHRSHPAHHA